MTDLLIRLENAKEGSRELDAEILRIARPEFADMQFHPTVAGWLIGGDHKQPEYAPRYTTSLDAALTLVPEGCIWATSAYTTFATADVTLTGEGFLSASGDVEFEAQAKTPALALCIAALRARAA